MTLREKVSQLPIEPGVYLYKDAAGKVIYVGKAKSLRSRVRSYFNDDRRADIKTGTLISEATDIDYIQVDNEKEALALENLAYNHLRQERCPTHAPGDWRCRGFAVFTVH